MDGSNFNVNPKTLFASKSTESLNTSMLISDSEFETKSLDLSTNNKLSLIDELKEKVRNLKLRLQSTDNETDNLLMKIITRILKMQVDRLNLQLIILKGLCRSPMIASKKGTPKTQKKKNQHLNLQDNKTDASKSKRQQKKTDVLDIEPQAIVYKGATTQTNNKENSASLTSDESNIKNDKKQNGHKIHVFGGQSCVGLASKVLLARTRMRRTKDYSIAAQSKPGATTEEILKCCNRSHVNTHDKLVLGIGENDCNPYKVIMELRSIVKQFPENDILVLNIVSNKHLKNV